MKRTFDFEAFICDKRRKTAVLEYFEVGDIVKTNMGTGKLLKIRPDGVYVVSLEEWELAE